MNMHRPKILVIDDESYIREFLTQVLSEHYHVFLARDGASGLQIATEVKPALIILDILMPGLSGIEVCRRLRGNPHTERIPVLMLTALDETQRKIEAFACGADDYMAKPFHPNELLARVAARLRRSIGSEALIAEPQLPPPGTRLSAGDLEIELSNMTASVANEPLELGPVEYKILCLLAQNVGRLVGREEIAQTVWQGKKDSARGLDPHINSLRKKLKSSRLEVKTVYGNGYSLIEKAGI